MPAPQLVFIHGGECFATYDAYLDALRSWEYEPPTVEHPKRWRQQLAADFAADGWEVHMPAMPSKLNAKYVEWKIWFQKVVPYLRDGVALVGHSLGGIFLAKYLSEERLLVRVRATFLIAAPYDATEPGQSLADFALPAELTGLTEQGGALFLYHSEDDDVVPFTELAKYQAQLPSATARVFTDRGHFLGSELPELLADVRALS